MSGGSRISAWAFDNIEIEEDDDFDSWMDRVDDAFTAENRSPARDILDSQELEQIETEFNNLQGALVEEPFGPDEPEGPDEVQPSVTSGLVALFG